MPAPLCSLQVQEHKTFHRYTVRARRGTAQGLRDAQTPGSAPRSAGASLRRYNEAALLKVRVHHTPVLGSWQGQWSWLPLTGGTTLLLEGMAGAVGSGKGAEPN